MANRQDNSLPTHSIIEYFYPPEDKGHRCGYCKSPDTNLSQGMWAHTIAPENYERLINQGWRRSGSYLYKPTNERTCCPMYTIRNLSTKVEISRSQRKVLKKFRKYLRDGNKGGGGGTEKKTEEAKGHHGRDGGIGGDEDVCMNNGEEMVTPVLMSSEAAPTIKPVSKAATTSRPQPTSNNPSKASGKGVTADHRHPLKKKPLRRERKRQKLIAKGLDPEEFFKRNERNRVKELEAFFRSDPPTTPPHGSDADTDTPMPLQFTTKLVRVGSPEFQEKYLELEHKLYQKYQMGIHGDDENECRLSQFKRFLCDNPFSPVEFGGSGGGHYDDGDGEAPQKLYLGPYHQHYYISSKLFAVGVIDILPSCVSSVYFFYDPEFSFLSPGTLGAMQEIHFVNKLAAINPRMEYYYLGFYIHSCVKMRYKAKFRPCQLVCPVTGEWAQFDGRVASLLDADKKNGEGFIQFRKVEEGAGNRDDDQCDGDMGDALDKVLILHKHRIYQFQDFLVIVLKGQNSPKLREMLTSYAKLVGPAVTSNMLIYVSAKAWSDSPPSSTSSSSS